MSIKSEKLYLSDISTSPFAHLYKSSYLNQDGLSRTELYLELESYWKSLTNQKKKLNNLSSKNQSVFRNQHELWLKDIPIDMPLTKNICHHFNSREFWVGVFDLMGGFAANSCNLSSDTIKDYLNSEENFSTYISFGTPGEVTKRRELHTDSNRVLFVLNYYVRLPDDFSSGGGLSLMSYDQRLQDLNFKKFFLSYLLNTYPSDISIEKTFEYKDDFLQIMPGGPWNWHEVSSRRQSLTPRIAFHSTVTLPKNHNTKWQRTNLEKNKIRDIFGTFKKKSGGPRA